MKIGSFVRTFEDREEQHIARFIESHLPFSDTIHISTCRTSDKTLAIASQYPNIKYREFNGVEYLEDGTPLAHESLFYVHQHLWSLESGMDWIIFDDADHYANPALQRDARHLLETNPTPLAYSLLLYVWGTTHYFPQLNECTPSERLWAWNIHEWLPELGRTQRDTVEVLNQPDAASIDKFIFFHPPYAILHHSWTTEEETLRKMKFNIKRGVPQVHPLEGCGRLEPIPQWALE